MDPNGVLRELRAAHARAQADLDRASRLQDLDESPADVGDAYDAALESLREVAGSVAELDAWLSTGGTLPEAWRAEPHT